ncbi:MAG TPA: hypothetical protein VMW16_09925 [Sedimentisphaerales bacterium]|nr:hypothetical protein [Sedimentisphaerales bacterium]
MKRLFVSTLIIVGGLFVLAQGFAAEENEGSKITEKRSSVSRRSPTRARRDRADANSVAAELKSLEDANAVKTNLRKFEGLEKAVDDLSRGGRKEIREWTQSTAEENVDLAKAVHEQAIDELAFIRKLASEEGALKTTAAIDALLLDRQERYGKMLDKMEANEKRMRRSDRDYRRTRGRIRNPRDRYREQDMYGEQNMYRGRETEPYGDAEERRTRGRTSRRAPRERDETMGY